MITEGLKLIQISVFLVFTKINPALLERQKLLSILHQKM